MRRWRQRYSMGRAPAAMAAQRALDIVDSLKREHGASKAAAIARLRLLDVKAIGDRTSIGIWETVTATLEGGR